jgi:hypothetical protein
MAARLGSRMAKAGPCAGCGCCPWAWPACSCDRLAPGAASRVPQHGITPSVLSVSVSVLSVSVSALSVSALSVSLCALCWPLSPTPLHRRVCRCSAGRSTLPRPAWRSFVASHSCWLTWLKSPLASAWDSRWRVLVGGCGCRCHSQRPRGSRPLGGTRPGRIRSKRSSSSKLHFYDLQNETGALQAGGRALRGGLGCGRVCVCVFDVSWVRSGQGHGDEPQQPRGRRGALSAAAQDHPPP